MGFVAPVIAGVGALVGARQQRKAAQSASDAQVSANQASIDEQRRRYDNNLKLLEPYVNVGVSALGQHNDLLGLNGAEKQQGAIDSLQRSPFLQSAYKQAENAILQNASATGGLRGGNIQGALADNRMNMLHQAYQGQVQNLGNLVSLGQNSAVGVGNAGMSLANNISQLNQGIGQAQAGNALARGHANSGIWNTIGGLGTLGVMNNMGLLGNSRGDTGIGLPIPKFLNF